MPRYLRDVRPTNLIRKNKQGLGGSLGRVGSKMLLDLSSRNPNPLDKAIRQSGHTVVNMGNDAEISNPFDPLSS
jgi:hypothetical protein